MTFTPDYHYALGRVRALVAARRSSPLPHDRKTVAVMYRLLEAMREGANVEEHGGPAFRAVFDAR